MWNLPNILTLVRICLTPVIALLPFIDGYWPKLICFAVFLFAAITDVVDGYLARSRNLVTDIGKLLDPIADKLLVAALLLMLVADGTIYGWTVLPALIILCREILVSGLREYLAELKVRLPVSILAKWKTTMQMVAMAFLIVGDVVPALPVQMVGEGLLWLAAALTLLTGYDYLRVGLKHMTEDDRADKKP